MPDMVNTNVETLITSKINNNDVISKIFDFLIGERSYWKSEYNKTIEALNETITDAIDVFEHWSERKIEDTHWLSFHYAFLDEIKHHFELVKCKQKNSKRILACLRHDYHIYHQDEYACFDDFKAMEYDFYCRKFIEWEDAYSKNKLTIQWEDL